MKNWLFVLGSLVLVVGCAKKDPGMGADYKPADTPYNGYSGNEPKEPIATEDKSTPEPGKTTPTVPKKPTDIPEPPKVSVNIPAPHTEGWGESDLTFAELGDKVAATMANLKGVYGEADLMVDNGEMSGKVTNRYKIRSGQEFAIEYNLPTNPSETNRLIANPSKGRAMLEKGSWKPIPKKRDGNLVETWPVTFPKEIFTGLVSGDDSWKPFLAALARGEGGFKATIEMRTVMPKGGGLPQKYYRVAATRETPRKEEIEARFDSAHYLPLAIRVKTTMKNGKKLETQWQARWSWEVPLKDSDFVLPKAM